MRIPVFVLAFALFTLTFLDLVPANAQDNDSSQTTTQTNNSDDTVEGTVVSVSRNTVVIRTDDNKFQLFTYDRTARSKSPLLAGARVRVTAGPADENGTRSASDITVVTAASSSGGDKGAKTAPVPPKVREVESDIRRESRRWALGVRAGEAFDPELFLFGIQSQMGPIFHPRVMFRPNAEFAFGEVTDLIALNLEAVYRFSPASRRGNWTPYVGAGPALIFIHQSYAQGRDINFSNFDYETGFNILVGMQHRRGTFVEAKTSLWSGPAPKFRLILGYNF